MPFRAEAIWGWGPLDDRPFGVRGPFKRGPFGVGATWGGTIWSRAILSAMIWGEYITGLIFKIITQLLIKYLLFLRL